MGAAAQTNFAEARPSNDYGAQDMTALVLQLMQELKEECAAHRKAIEDNNLMMQQILQHIHTQVKPWLSVEEAIDLCGLNRAIKKHRNKLANGCRRFGVRSVGEKPPRYCREDIERMAKAIKEGKFML